MSENGQTLYERIGGGETVARLIDTFYARVVVDPDLGHFFKYVEMGKLRRMQQEFFSAALDGPIAYSGLSLSHVHHGRGIRREHFARFVDHLLTTLKGEGIQDSDANEIIQRISAYVDDIVGGGGIDG